MVMPTLFRVFGKCPWVLYPTAIGLVQMALAYICPYSPS
jgi:hypothetical protein